MSKELKREMYRNNFFIYLLLFVAFLGLFNLSLGNSNIDSTTLVTFLIFAILALIGTVQSIISFKKIKLN